MRATIAFAAILMTCSAGTVLAQGLPGGGNLQNVPQKAPPVKKFQGVCYAPDSIFYKRITEGFFPFVAMIDCVKSGGLTEATNKAKK
jgi:hypothetical protein